MLNETRALEIKRSVLQGVQCERFGSHEIRLVRRPFSGLRFIRDGRRSGGTRRSSEAGRNIFNNSHELEVKLSDVEAVASRRFGLGGLRREPVHHQRERRASNQGSRDQSLQAGGRSVENDIAPRLPQFQDYPHPPQTPRSPKEAGHLVAGSNFPEFGNRFFASFLLDRAS